MPLLRLLAVLLSIPSVIHAADYDVIVRGARVIDGTGTPARMTDIGIRGARIAALGDLRTATANQTIDAHGLVAAPGFIDNHSHLGDHELLQSELAGCAPMLAQGVTTVVINADGWGVVDLSVQIAQIKRARPGVNVVPMVGHKAVRTAVLGFADRLPTPAELDQMRTIVRTGFERDGAFGLTTGLIYAPANFSRTEELVALARIGAEFGGVYHSHIRDEGEKVGTAVDELITIVRQAGLPGIITHIKCAGPKAWGQSRDVIRQINAARNNGVAIWADQYPYEASLTYLAANLLPAWAQAGGRSATVGRLKDQATREKIRAEALAQMVSRGGAEAFLIARNPPNRSLEGRKLSVLARDRSVEPIDLALDLIRDGEPSSIVFSMNDADIVAFMQQPWTMTGSDGFGLAEAHPRSFGTFTRKLRSYALDREVISLERAIHSMSGQTAEVLHLLDRGQLRVGAFADLAIFDPAKLRDRATYEHPQVLAEGMVCVLVNGQPALTDGKPTSVRAGEVLVRQQKVP